jgi:short-subunit dehydrogenase involved in D-alanine esterification of teichoic acids
MKTVAIVGGTSSLGLHIAEAIKAKSPNWRLIILSRSQKTLQSPENVSIVQVSYEAEHVEELATTLRKQNVHTIICCIGAYDESLFNCQKSLVDAARKSGTVKRFVPSEWEGQRGMFSYDFY